MPIKLLDNVSADTNGAAFPCDGGNQTFSVWATSFGGGTVTLQASPDAGTTWITLTINGDPATFTANDVKMVDRLGVGMRVRATLTGSTSPVALSAALFG